MNPPIKAGDPEVALLRHCGETGHIGMASVRDEKVHAVAAQCGECKVIYANSQAISVMMINQMRDKFLEDWSDLM